VSALAARLAPSWVHLSLDTHAPQVTLETAERVEPPDALEALIRADEPMGHVTVSLTDAAGIQMALGHEVVDEASVRLLVPSVGLATGPALLRVIVADLACNTTVLQREVGIMRPRPYDVVLSLVAAFSVALSIDHAFDNEMALGGAFALSLSVDHAFEADLATTPALAVTMGVRRAPEQ
jgi:hypothetical protein